jgi:hypothetical protein
VVVVTLHDKFLGSLKAWKQEKEGEAQSGIRITEFQCQWRDWPGPCGTRRFLALDYSEMIDAQRHGGVPETDSRMSVDAQVVSKLEVCHWGGDINRKYYNMHAREHAAAGQIYIS